jgi:hypothetical protein
MVRKLIFSAGIAVLVCAYSALAQAQTGRQRIEVPVIINGQQTQGALVIQGETVQSFRCKDPQQYVSANQSESGWACFDPSTGVWLLHAEPPLNATVPQQESVIVYRRPAPVYVPYYSNGYYPYNYYYYPYAYPYSYPFFRSRFGIGFGFGFGFGYRAPVIVNRSVIGRSPYGFSRPFGGFRYRGSPGFVRHGRR